MVRGAGKSRVNILPSCVISRGVNGRISWKYRGISHVVSLGRTFLELACKLPRYMHDLLPEPGCDHDLRRFDQRFTYTGC